MTPPSAAFHARFPSSAFQLPISAFKSSQAPNNQVFKSPTFGHESSPSQNSFARLGRATQDCKQVGFSNRLNPREHGAEGPTDAFRPDTRPCSQRNQIGSRRQPDRASEFPEGAKEADLRLLSQIIWSLPRTANSQGGCPVCRCRVFFPAETPSVARHEIPLGASSASLTRSRTCICAA